MRYTTVLIDLLNITIGEEDKAVINAISKALKTLSEEIGGNPVELVNVAYVVVNSKLCVTVLARPYQPVELSSAGILQAMKALNWGPETTKGGY